MLLRPPLTSAVSSLLSSPPPSPLSPLPSPLPTLSHLISTVDRESEANSSRHCGCASLVLRSTCFGVGRQLKPSSLRGALNWGRWPWRFCPLISQPGPPTRQAAPDGWKRSPESYLFARLFLTAAASSRLQPHHLSTSTSTSILSIPLLSSPLLDIPRQFVCQRTCHSFRFRPSRSLSMI